MSTKTIKAWMSVGILVATFSIATASAAAPAAPAAPAVTPVAGKTADAVLAEYLAARGGSAKLQAIKSLRLTGKFSGGPADLAVTVQKKRPNKMRRDINGPDGKLVQAFDGQSAWQLGGPNGPKAAPAPDPIMRRLRRASELEGPVPGKSATDRIDLLGKEKVGGHEAYLVKAKLKDGSEVSYDFDTSSHLLIRMTEALATPAGTKSVETSFRDYKSVGGVMWPFTEAIATEGGMSQTVTWNKIEANPPVEDSVFKMPS